MAEIEDWLAENYRAIQAETGRPWADLAAEHRDPEIAAWMRSQDSGKAAGPKGRKAAGPKGRKAPDKSEA